MTRTTSGRTWTRLLLATTAALALAAVSALGAPPSPAPGTANVDGNDGEWTSADHFSDMIRAGGNGGQTTVESKLSLRYDCETQVLYALVTAQPGVTISTTTPGDNFIKIGGDKKVDGNSGDDGIAPDFHYVGASGGTATGWEASTPLAPGSYTINVHTQVNDGGLQTSAVPGRSIPLEISCGEQPPKKPLKVEKTATTSYERTFGWLVAKSAAPAEVTTGDSTASTTYTVTVTKSGPTDSGFTVSGDITVSNPNGFPVTGATITDAIDGGPACPVTNGTGVTIPADGSVTRSYTCSVASAASGNNTATATWTGGSSAGEAPFSFGAPTKVTNATVDVTDAFDGGVPALLVGGDDLAASATFTYTRTVAVPATGCLIYPNVAAIVSPDGLSDQASAQFKACRTPAVAPPAVIGGVTTPLRAALRLTKRGPLTAPAGRVVTFTMVVRNTSANAATAVVLSDTLPSGYAVTRIPAGATLKSGRVTWRLGTLAAGASRTLRLPVRIDRSVGGRRCNTAAASAGNAATVRARACTAITRVAGASRIPIVTG